MKSKQGSRSAANRIDTRITDLPVFKLIIAMNGLVRPFKERYGERFDLSLTEWRVLAMVAAEPGISGEDLARRLYMEPMTVSRMVRSLESGGRLKRRADSTNRKRNLWRLTAKGWRVFDEIAPDAQQRQEKVLSGFSKREREVFSRLLDKILSELEE